MVLDTAFVSDTHVGGTLYTSQMRLEGTFLGVTVGYILLKLLRAGLPEIGCIFLLTLWMIPCGYFRSDSSRSYSGLVSAFTAALIFTGYSEQKGWDIDYWGISRIELTFIGIATLWVVLLIISPNNARSLLDQEVAESIQLMAEMFENVFDRFREMVVASTDYEDEDDVKADQVPHSNGSPSNGPYEQKMSPKELSQWFLERKSRVTELLESERILISAAVFEPVLHHKPFNDDLYHRLNHFQFWMLRRICWLNQCMESLLVYVERQDRSTWLLDEQLVNDITPFSIYLKPFTKYKNIIVGAMEFFVQEFSGEHREQDEEKERDGFKNYEDVTKALEGAISEQWKGHEQFLNEYIETKTMNKSELMTARGALIRTAVTFAVKNMTLSLSEFAQCQLESPP